MSFKSSYVLDSSSLWDVSFANIFSQYISLMYHTFGGIFLKSSLYSPLSRFSLVLSSVCSYTFMLYILVCDLFWLNFCEGCKVCVYICRFASGCPVVSTLLKRLSFLYFITISPLSTISCPIYVGLLLGSAFSSFDLFVCYLIKTILSFCSIILSLQIG